MDGSQGVVGSTSTDSDFESEFVAKSFYVSGGKQLITQEYTFYPNLINDWDHVGYQFHAG